MVAGTSETRNAHQLISDARHCRDHDHWKHPLAVMHTVPDNAGNVPNIFATPHRCSPKFYDLSAAFHMIAPWRMQKAKPSAPSTVLCRDRFAHCDGRGLYRLVQIID